MTTAEFERQIGVSGGYISNISKSIQPDKLEKISKIYPDLNIEWLLIGKGAMINNIVRLNIDKEKIQDMQNVPDYIEIPEQAKDIIERVLQGTSKNSDNPVMVAEPSTEYGENKISQVKVETRPRVPYTAAAGSLTSAVEGVTATQCEQTPRINVFPDYDFTIIIKGSSMEPKYEGGDEVACKRIDRTSFIQWGKVHVLDTAQGIIIKRIYEDGEKIRCVSYNPEYPDFSIDKSEIYSMSLVVGLIRL